MRYQQTRRKLVLAGVASAAAMALPRVHAAAYPDRAVRILVGFPPGQSTDTITRMWTDELAKTFSQAFIVDNRPGAGGTIATTAAVRANPDGYTLLGASGSVAIYPHAYPQLKLDPVADFTHICRTVTVPLVLIANNDFAAKDFRQFVQMARQTGSPLPYASGGVGITAHLAMEMLASQGGLKLSHIPYKGSPAAITDLIGGRVNVMFDVTTTLLPQLASGKVRALAVASPTRLPELPDVPTIAESGFPGFEALTWGIFSGPANLPTPVVQSLSQEMKRILELPSINSRLAPLGVSTGWLSSENTTAYMRSETAKWANVIKQANVKFD